MMAHFEIDGVFYLMAAAALILTLLVSESESEWLYYVVHTLRKGQANLLMSSCTDAM